MRKKKEEEGGGKSGEESGESVSEEEAGDDGADEVQLSNQEDMSDSEVYEVQSEEGEDLAITIERSDSGEEEDDGDIVLTGASSSMSDSRSEISSSEDSEDLEEEGLPHARGSSIKNRKRSLNKSVNVDGEDQSKRKFAKASVVLLVYARRVKNLGKTGLGFIVTEFYPYLKPLEPYAVKAHKGDKGRYGSHAEGLLPGPP